MLTSKVYKLPVVKTNMCKRMDIISDIAEPIIDFTKRLVYLPPPCDNG